MVYYGTAANQKSQNRGGIAQQFEKSMIAIGCQSEVGVFEK